MGTLTFNFPVVIPLFAERTLHGNDATYTLLYSVLSVGSVVFVGSTPLGGPLLGVVCDRYGARAGLVLGGVAALAAAGWGLLADRRLIRASGATGEADSAGRSAAAVGRGQGVDHQGAIVPG